MSDNKESQQFEALGISAVSQIELEEGIIARADQEFRAQEKERLTKIFERERNDAQNKLNTLVAKGNTAKSDAIPKEDTTAAAVSVEKLQEQITDIKAKLSKLSSDQGENDLLDSIFGTETADSNQELQKDISLGDATPFGTRTNKRTSTSSTVNSLNPLSQYFKSQQAFANPTTLKRKNLSKEKKRENFFDSQSKAPSVASDQDSSSSCYPRQRTKYPSLRRQFREDGELSDPGEWEDESYHDDDYVPDERELDTRRLDDDEPEQCGLIKKSKRRKISFPGSEFGIERTPKKAKGKTKYRDDGNMKHYMARIRRWEEEEAARERAADHSGSETEELVSVGDGGFGVPGRLWSQLYQYQRTGVRWLWELHAQQCGGIVGDEMGLGKTIQTIAFLAGLRESRLRDPAMRSVVGLGPVLVVCPATVMHQWARECHRWWPAFRVAVLHSSGSFSGDQNSLMASMVKSRGILITSYSYVTNRPELPTYNWHYVILDEGHKIRNPDAQITTACKQFRTCHRIILSGSPVQNNLRELWSLFDFIFPGKLGTLPEFMTNFSIPIVQGGYSNATQVQVQTAYKCACVLRDNINPYLLRRMKADVNTSLLLPNKNEQKEVYKEYLDSKECQQILNGNYMVFPGLITLRKICNHPDLSTGGPRVFRHDDPVTSDPALTYGWWTRSGKMLVLDTLLRLWRKQGHRVLLFTQSRQMLDILEVFMEIGEHSFLRMDGSTNIAARQPLIKKYNENPDIFVFLLTTRVGGLGVNLTGANRVVIYDPDWNPSTDIQARERAWRIGQSRDVTIYRLVTAGTVEEKIYHRQIFKQFLTNRVLKDPKQRRFFKSNDLFELFTLGDDSPKNETETSTIFAGTDITVKKIRRQNRFDELQREKRKHRKRKTSDDCDGEDEDENPGERARKLAEMRELARKLARQMTAARASVANHNEKPSNKDVTEINHVKSESEIPPPATNDMKETRRKLKHKQSSKRSSKGCRFEGERIKNLVRQQSVDDKSDRREADSKTQDAYVLHKLLKRTVIHSALQHDAIVQNDTADFALVEGEAERVAQQAAQALRESRERCQGATPGELTWTGATGCVGVPVQQKKLKFGPKKTVTEKVESVTPQLFSVDDGESRRLFDGSASGVTQDQAAATQSLSSQDLLSRMRKRNGLAGGGPADSGSALLEDIRGFMAFQSSVNGQASTDELLQRFRDVIPAGGAAGFKAMLKQVAVFRRHEGLGMWRLKPEFR